MIQMNDIITLMADVTGQHLREKIVPQKAAIAKAAVENKIKTITVLRHQCGYNFEVLIFR